MCELLLHILLGKTVGLPMNKVTVTNPLNLLTNQKCSLDVKYKIFECQHSKW